MNCSNKKTKKKCWPWIPSEATLRDVAAPNNNYMGIKHTSMNKECADLSSSESSMSLSESADVMVTSGLSWAD